MSVVGASVSCLLVCVCVVAGLVDAFLYHSSRAIQRKIQLGKTTWRQFILCDRTGVVATLISTVINTSVL